MRLESTLDLEHREDDSQIRYIFMQLSSIKHTHSYILYNMPCYGLFLCNILNTDLHWILPLCALLYLDITHVTTTFKVH